LSVDEGDQRRLLATCVERTGLSVEELWLRYFALDGEVGPVEVEAYLHGLMPLPDTQRDVLAHAINERLDELDWLRWVPYSRTVRQAKPATGGQVGSGAPTSGGIQPSGSRPSRWRAEPHGFHDQPIELGSADVTSKLSTRRPAGGRGDSARCRLLRRPGPRARRTVR
jgi:hypothetical protein